MEPLLSVLNLTPLSQNAETSRLLDEDPYRTHYGAASSHNNQRVIQQQPDPETLRREREAMEGICIRMSEYVHKERPFRGSITNAQHSHVVDVFTVTPQETPNRYISTGNATKENNPATITPSEKKTEEQTATNDERAYKSVRRKGREPLSLELGHSENEAAKAAMG